MAKSKSKKVKGSFVGAPTPQPDSVGAIGQEGVDLVEKQLSEKLERRRHVVDSQGASWESSPSKSAAHEGAAPADVDRVRRHNEKRTSLNGKRVGDSEAFSGPDDERKSCSDTIEESEFCSAGLEVAGSDLSASVDAPNSQAYGTAGELATPVIEHQASDDPTAVHEMQPVESTTSSTNNVQVQEGQDFRCTEAGDFRCTPTPFWDGLYAQFAPACEDQISVDVEDKKTLHTWGDGDMRAPEGGASSAVKRFLLRLPRPLKASSNSADGDACTNTGGDGKAPEGVTRFRLRLPQTLEGVRLRVGTWKNRSSMAARAGAVRRRLHFVRSKASKIASQTRNGLVNIQDVRAKVSKKTQRRASEARAMTSQLSDKAGKGFEYVKAAPESLQAKAESHMASARVMKERAESHLLSEREQMSDAAQRGLEYVKGQAQIFSTDISRAKEQAQIAAQKGLVLAKNLGRFGGA